MIHFDLIIQISKDFYLSVLGDEKNLDLLIFNFNFSRYLILKIIANV